MADNPDPDESSPLLHSALPDIQAFTNHLQSLPQAAEADSVIYEFVKKQNFNSDIHAKAFTLVICCFALSYARPNGAHVLDIEHVSRILTSEWTSVVLSYPDQEIDEILWTAFPSTDANMRPGVLLVIDALTRVNVPRAISMHPRIVQSMLVTWKLGSVQSRKPRAMWIDRIDAMATPRILHAIELIYFLLHISLLSYYILIPPIAEIQSNPPLDWRAFVLAVSSVSSILRRSWRSSLPFALIILAVIFALPASPHPNGLPFIAMLLSLTLHFLQVHMPHGPSVVFLMPQNRSLLLSCMLETVIFDIFLPIMLYILPVLIISTLLLSFSLAEPFGPLSTFSIVVEITPISSRYTLFFIVLGIIIVFVCLSMAMVILLPHIRYIRDDEVVSWDGFTVELALQTRRAMLECLIDYAKPFRVPAPFTLLELIFITFPALALQFFRKGELAQMIRNVFTPSLWRCSILPFAYLIGTFWLWNLRTK